MPIRIVIIDDDESSRFLYKLNFRNLPDLEIVGEFENGEDPLPVAQCNIGKGTIIATAYDGS